MSQEIVRTVVDCPSRLPNGKWRTDTSAVFNIEMLDDDDRDQFNPAYPWLFDTDEWGIQGYKYEDDACQAQRDYRQEHGFDPITGTRI